MGLRPEASVDSVKLKQIFLFWLPLYASWLLMVSEGPLLSAMVNRLPDEVTMLAAFGIALALAVTIESPVINLLSTSTALVRDRPSYLLVRRFTLELGAFMTLVAVILSFTPVFDWLVVDLLATPQEIAHWVRPGLQILFPWTAAIAWRRFLQGILIRHGSTRLVARGTMIRLVATVGTGLGLATLSDWPGVSVGASALLVGVTVEALYAHWAAAPVVRDLSPVQAADRPPLDYRRLLFFHLPLAGTSVLALMVQPVVAWALARLALPELSLAAWPLVFHLGLAIRAPALALPEVIIALADQDGAIAGLRRFVWRLGFIFTGLMVLFVTTPLVDLYLVGFQDAADGVARLARLGLQLFLPLPALGLWISWLRGMLIHQHRTRVVNEGMAILLLTLVGSLVTAVHLRLPGLASAAVALQAAILIQGIYLVIRGRSGLKSAEGRTRASQP